MFRPVSVEDYKFSRCLGKGAGGKVKLGKNNDGEKVAVKVSRIHESNPSTANKSSESSFDKVLNEAECLHECRGHNNIVDFVDFMSTDRKYYIVTEYVDGGDLWDFVTSVDRLPEATAKNLFKQLITAVQHMHSRGIGHRDIKPENILVSRDGETAKLCDFGFATKFKEGDELLPGTMGTVRCLAPEMIKRKGWEKPVHDPFQADMWGCGIVLHYMLSGMFPFEMSKDRNTLINTVRGDLVNPLPASVSPEARDLVKKMLQHNPKKRPTPAEVLAHPFFA